MKKLTKLVAACMMVFAILAINVSSVAYADTTSKVKEGVSAVNVGSSTDLPGFIKAVIGVLLFIVGAVSVIMIIVGGIRYVTSNGDQAHVKAAKDTILYAVIGLIVALLAYAIVNFVTTNIT